MTCAAGLPPDREVWTLTFPAAGRGPEAAVAAEIQGWDGILIADSQNLTGDVYATLTAAAAATERILLGPGVTNSVTRDPAVTASGIATVQQYSGGRAVLGIGRGDSAVAYLGKRPAPVPEFEDYLRDVQAYLRGEVVDRSGFPSRLEWLPATDLPKVPVEVAATGPKVLAAAARTADRIAVTVGADPGRVRWAIDTARQAREEAGLDPAGLSFGAYVNAVAHPDRSVAREVVRGSFSTLVRFGGMSDAGSQVTEAADRSALATLARDYSIRRHAMRETGHAAAIDDGLVDRFAVVGPSEHCAERLQELFDVGLDRLIIAGHSRDADPALLTETAERFASEVLPMVRKS
ncbi:LLM class flavin-dependent oxidoreductase [Actinomadura rudentiformis]|uniref:LLM class flavin-dependent oxidoreductase n=1 Tax=Actinomadura rudentiformis TaxID=359158 RepID=A0A6H9YL57_9ACTN|nr:LLM class flavin-dependent oxidoreductase [Actinomadura rudentiformis]KAB2345275.1 LLM class flavin-dependent oxidoreductase [Actinomadura rudentiformis]